MFSFFDKMPINRDSFLEDFHQKETNIAYQNHFLQYPNQVDLFDVWNRLQKENKVSALREAIDTIRHDVLYFSETHGIKHNVRVLVWTFYLGCCYHLSSEDFIIAIDGARYHDIGRMNDLEDVEHGKRSADQVIAVVTDEIYQEKQNKLLLQAIIALHSVDDDRKNEIIQKYQIIDHARFTLLYSILKDSDALDRIRLSYLGGQYSELNPKYLRLEESKKLLKSTHQLLELERTW